MTSSDTTRYHVKDPRLVGFGESEKQHGAGAARTELLHSSCSMAARVAGANRDTKTITMPRRMCTGSIRGGEASIFHTATGSDRRKKFHNGRLGLQSMSFCCCSVTARVRVRGTHPRTMLKTLESMVVAKASTRANK